MTLFEVSKIIGNNAQLGTHAQRVEYLKRLAKQAKRRGPSSPSKIMPDKRARRGLQVCLKLSGFSDDIKQYFVPLHAVGKQWRTHIDRTHGRLS